jgi:hypothetical protein
MYHAQCGGANTVPTVERVRKTRVMVTSGRGVTFATLGYINAA